MFSTRIAPVFRVRVHSNTRGELGSICPWMKGEGGRICWELAAVNKKCFSNLQGSFATNDKLKMQERASVCTYRFLFVEFYPFILNEFV